MTVKKLRPADDEHDYRYINAMVREGEIYPDSDGEWEVANYWVEAFPGDGMLAGFRSLEDAKACAAWVNETCGGERLDLKAGDCTDWLIDEARDKFQPGWPDFGMGGQGVHCSPEGVNVSIHYQDSDLEVTLSDAAAVRFAGKLEEMARQMREAVDKGCQVGDD